MESAGFVAPEWLPPLVRFSEYGNWPAYVDAIYEFYLNDFVRSRFTVGCKPLKMRRFPQTQGKDKAFWHLCGHDEGQSEPTDFSRCERIRWPKPILLNRGDRSVKMWAADNFKTSNGKLRVLVWFNDEYLVVLEPRADYVLLVTAYPTQYRNTIRDRERSFQARKGEKIPW